MPKNDGCTVRALSALKTSWLRPLKMSETDSLNWLLTRTSSAANAADENCDPSTKSGVAQTFPHALSSHLRHSSVGNSDNQKGGQYMPRPEIARDEETRCVSPQRVVSEPSSRVLPFPSLVEMSDEDRLRLLCEHDPDGYAALRRFLTHRLDRLGL